MKRKLFTSLFGLVVLIITSYGQQTIITGRVIDAETKEPLPYVTIILKGSSIGSITDNDGNYTVRTEDVLYKEILFSFLGYKSIVKKVALGQTQTLNIRLSPDATLLGEVEVRPGKERDRYRNKDNPAVRLVREMIAHKNQNRVERYSFVEYEQYEKIQMSLSNVSEKYKDRKLFRKYKWLFENVDTLSIPGKALLPIYLQEKLTDEYIMREPQIKKSVEKANQKVSIDDYVDNQGVSNYLKYVYSDVDIYDNNINLFTNQFLSPIADSAPLFYKFYITDTLKNEIPQLVELMFVPRNTTDFLFQGKLYVTLDSNYAVKKLDMSVNKKINLNWVRELYIDQQFEKLASSRYHLLKSKIRADFGLSKEGGGLYGERVLSFKNFTTNKERPVEFYKMEESAKSKVDEIKKTDHESFLSTNRHDSLTLSESKVYQTIDSLQKMRSFRRTLDIATLLLAGYKNLDWWELGPVNTFYSFNPVEGLRLRVGGRTTPKFNDRLYFETYAAYGSNDKKWKYFLSANYSFTGRSIREFPVRALRISYQRDTKIPGQELQFIQEDNFLLSFKRGVNDKWLYNKIWNIDYLHEFANHFSYRLGAKYWEQIAAGGLTFEKGNLGAPINQVTTAELYGELRWAPEELFYQGKSYRIPIPNKYPVVTARYTAGIMGLINGQYNYHDFTLNVFKRVYLSQLGYTDIVVEGRYIAGKIPFPLLSIHRANQTYSYQLQSYNLMNFLEFVSDEYVSVNLDHYFNGFIFNKIPVVKRLKWREVITLKVLYGSLRKENDPNKNSESFVFPVSETGQVTTFSLTKEPYLEASVGIANIFKLIRVDAVKRLTYLNNPGVAEWGIRARVKFDF